MEKNLIFLNNEPSEFYLGHYERHDFSFELKERVAAFAQEAFRGSRRRESPVHKNYVPESEYSLEDLLFRRKRFQGWTAIENKNQKILSASGYYNCQNILIGGVRSLSLTESTAHKFFHAAFALPLQKSLAKELKCRAFVMTVARNNESVANLIRYYSRKSLLNSNELLVRTNRFFSSFDEAKQLIEFNGIQQYVFYHAFAVDFNPLELSGLLLP